MRLALFRRLCLIAALVALCVVVLGAWVRLSHAGLGCPDWPGCYGHLTVGQALDNADHANAAFPERPLEADKALKEMIHRYLATGLGLLILAIAAVAWSNRRDPAQPVRLPGFLVLLVVFQGLLGMWTVTLLLKPAIVSAHLVGGLTTMALLWWLALRVDRTTRSAAESGLRSLAAVRPRGARDADPARRLGQHELRGAGVPGFPDLPAFVLAGHGFQGRLRALARPRHRLRGRCARPSGAGRHPLRAPHRRAGDGRGARVPRLARDPHGALERGARRRARRWPCCWLRSGPWDR